MKMQNIPKKKVLQHRYQFPSATGKAKEWEATCPKFPWERGAQSPRKWWGQFGAEKIVAEIILAKTSNLLLNSSVNFNAYIESYNDYCKPDLNPRSFFFTEKRIQVLFMCFAMSALELSKQTLSFLKCQGKVLFGSHNFLHSQKFLTPIYHCCINNCVPGSFPQIKFL